MTEAGGVAIPARLWSPRCAGGRGQPQGLPLQRLPGTANLVRMFLVGILDCGLRRNDGDGVVNCVR